MEPQRCQVYTTKGTQCSKAHKVNSQYCTLHENKREQTGPHQFAREQLAIRQKFEWKQQESRFQLRRNQAGSPQEIREITNEETMAIAEMTVRHRRESDAQRDAQEAEIAENGGRDPDRPAQLRREIDRLSQSVVMAMAGANHHRGVNREMQHHWIRRLTELSERIVLRYIPENEEYRENAARLVVINDSITAFLLDFEQRQVADAGVAGWGGEVPQRLGPIVMAVPNRELARIANDNQNVHTTLVVEQTKKNVQEILKIPVPEIFKWQRNRLSMTYKTIIMFCHLSPKAVWQFSSMYCSDATIYDLEPGIFGKVVDGVWQFIRSSPDKADLKKILAAELRDNIGMCAQGNLSRMCNVLQGYLEGIGQKESVAEILGREFPKLMEVENETERVYMGTELLRNNNVPDDQWEAWLEPLRA